MASEGGVLGASPHRSQGENPSPYGCFFFFWGEKRKKKGCVRVVLESHSQPGEGSRERGAETRVR